jgi:hypothetical protein
MAVQGWAMIIQFPEKPHDPEAQARFDAVMRADAALKDAEVTVEMCRLELEFALVLAGLPLPKEH